MQQKTKILIAAVLVLAGVWITGFFRFVQPLYRATDLRVIYYTDDGEFKENAVVYKKIFNNDVYYLSAPNARPTYRWWAVDFNSCEVFSADAPRRLFSSTYVFRDHAHGVRIDNRDRMGEWDWQCTPDSVSFAGNGFACSITKLH